jgi:hypothetical protein
MLLFFFIIILIVPEMTCDGDCEETGGNEDWQGKPKYSEKTCLQRHFAHHKSHMTRPGFEPGPPRWEAND